jgi:hypothetical protein
MDMSKLSQEPPINPEEVFNAICEEYDTINNCHPKNNNKLLLRYIINPVNLDYLKELIRRLHNDPYKKEYILDRLLNFSKELNKLSNLAELYEKEARTCR